MSVGIKLAFPATWIQWNGTGHTIGGQTTGDHRPEQINLYPTAGSPVRNRTNGKPPAIMVLPDAPAEGCVAVDCQVSLIVCRCSPGEPYLSFGDVTCPNCGAEPGKAGTGSDSTPIKGPEPPPPPPEFKVATGRVRSTPSAPTRGGN